MELPHVPVVEAGSAFCQHSGVCRHEMWLFGDGIDHNHHCVEAVCVGEFHDEVNTDLLPESLGHWKWVEQANQLASEDLVSEAGLTGLGVLSNVS